MKNLLWFGTIVLMMTGGILLMFGNDIGIIGIIGGGACNWALQGLVVKE